MSFILDALKKSETDRQEKSAPDISDVPTARPAARSSAGAWYLVGFLSLIVVALMAVLLRPAPGPAPMVSQELALPERNTSVPAPQSPPAEVSGRGDAGEAVAVSETPRPSEVADSSGESRELAAVAALPAASDPPPPPVQQPVTQQAVTQQPVTQESYLTFNDLRASGNIDLPDLHIDLHVFSEEPGDRFVFINMNQYRENAVLSEGPRLREITTEGVLLEYVGTTFLLPRE